MDKTEAVRAIEWRDDTLILLDQRKLPASETYIKCVSLDDVITGIKDMLVRGAPAIGIAAAYGCVIAASHRLSGSSENWQHLLSADFQRLAEARPTAVNLAWAVQRMQGVLESSNEEALYERLLQEAISIHQQDIAANHRMADLAMPCLASSAGEGAFPVLTHCNTGSLATGGFGTALGVIRRGCELGYIDQVFADETRPWLQGSRLTAWELKKDGLPVTLCADSAASWLLKEGRVRWVIVGADRIAANGDVANKIGTYNLAVSAKYHGVRFMVVAPFSTVDMAVSSGNDIEIEDRGSKELLEFGGQPIAPQGVETVNPVFDVTPASLIDVIVTERGIVSEPSMAKMQALAGSAS